jgi:hypothetical protein
MAAGVTSRLWEIGDIVDVEGLPALSSLVVEKATGLPSTGLTTVSADEFPAEQQRVFLSIGFRSFRQPFRS